VQSPVQHGDLEHLNRKLQHILCLVRERTKGKAGLEEGANPNNNVITIK